MSVSYQSLTDTPETKSVGNQSQSEYEGTATAGEVEYERVKRSVLDKYGILIEGFKGGNRSSRGQRLTT